MPFKFYIQDLYDRTEVVEPNGWKDIISVLSRDFAVHGVFFNYTDGTLKLGFSCEGKVLLEAAYLADGSEAYYLFEVEEAENNHSAYSVIYSGEMDFKTRNYNEDFWEVEVNELNNLIRLQNRADIKMNINTATTIDGAEVGKLNYDDSIKSLATKSFAQLIVKRSGLTLDPVQSTAATTNSYLFANFGFDSVESNEIKKYHAKETRMNSSVISGDLLTLEQKSSLSMNFDFDFDLNFTEDQGGGTTTYFSSLKIKFDPPINGVLSEIPLATDNDSGASPLDVTSTIVGNVDQYITAESGTKIWFDLEIIQTSTGTTQMTCELDITKFDVTITDKQGVFGTVAQWYNAHDVLRKILLHITNEQNYLYSDLLGNLANGYNSDGCLGNLMLTNGFRVRQSNTDLNAPTFSFKSLVDNLNTMHSVGYGIEELDSPTELINYDLYWVEISSGIAEARILDANMVYDILIGTKLSFYNSEDIYGTYEVTNVVYNALGDYTTIFFDVSSNTNYYDAFVGNPNPMEATVYPDVFIITDDSAGLKERLRLDQWEHFYSDSELIDLGVVQEYSEEPFAEVLYNELEIKFNKYSNDEDEAGSIEEFHTKSGWALPLVKAKNKLNLAMSWIGSTILFNESRAKIVSDNPTTSHVLDNDIFFCEKSERKGTFTVDFNSVTKTITFSAAAYENFVEGGEFFELTGATDAGNNGSYQIAVAEQVIYSVEDDTYKVEMTSVATTRSADEVFIDMTWVFQELYKPRANEDNISESGLTLPEYIMNQHKTMKRFLIKWGSFINSTISYLIDSVQTIRNVLFENNGAFTVEIDSYDLDSDCIDVWGPVREDENIGSDELDSAKFKPNFLHGTTYICDSDFNRIKDAHKNKLGIAGVQFDGSLYGTIPDTDEFKVTKWGFEILFDTGDYTDLAGTAAFVFALGGDFNSKEGVHLQFFEPNGWLRVFYGSDFATPARIVYNFEHNTKYRIRFESIGGSQERAWVNNVEVNTVGGVGTVSWGANDSIFGTGSQTGGVGYPSQWFNGILYEFEYYQINSSYEKLSSLIKLDIANGTSSEIPNIAGDAPASTEVSMSVAPEYLTGLSERNYGYITMTSPNGKTVLGWLMEMKRNPIDRITKVKLLEKA